MNVKETEIGLIPEDWEVKRIDEISKVTDSLHQTPVYSDKGFPMVRVTDVKRGYLSLQDCLLVSDDIYKVFTKNYKPQKGDIVISRVGTYGVSSIVKTDEQFCLGQNTAIISPKINNDYLYYCLNSPSIKAQIDYLAVGSTHKTISLKSIKSIKIPVCSENEQKVIAATLSVLDDMIELNNQINKTLEEMAKAIFKSWFVDFEPFKDGEFEESELGLIPKGWRVGVLGDIIDIFDSKRVPLSNRQRSVMEKKYPYYGAATLMDYVDNYIFDGVYVLLGEDGTVMDEKGYPILQYVWGKFWVNNHAHVLKGKGVFSDEYLYILLKNTNVASIVTGAVQLKINQNNLTGLKIMIPPEDVVKQYNDVVKDIFACFRSNADEIKILISLRDTLLPKLISGEIRVPVEEVV